MVKSTDQNDLHNAEIVGDDSSARNMQLLMHQYLKETSVKYDIALTKLSFFTFSNVSRQDIAKDVVKFCLSSRKTFKAKMAADHKREFFSKAWSLCFERFSRKKHEFVKNLLLI